MCTENHNHPWVEEGWTQKTLVEIKSFVPRSHSSCPFSQVSNSPDKLAEVFRARISRLLKADLLGTLSELLRQNEIDLALQVFDFARKESWYELNLSLYSDMIMVLGKNSMVEMAEKLFFELEKEGLRPDTRTYTEIIGAYFRVNMVDKAMLMYESMKASGCVPDKFTFTILLRNLEKTGENELVAAVKKDCATYLEFSGKFFEDLGNRPIRSQEHEKINSESRGEVSHKRLAEIRN